MPLAVWELSLTWATLVASSSAAVARVVVALFCWSMAPDSCATEPVRCPDAPVTSSAYLRMPIRMPCNSSNRVLTAAPVWHSSS